MNPMLPSLVTTTGLVFDIIGALLVANEVVRVFNGSATIDVGDAGCLNGRTRLVPNPKFEAHEHKKRKFMKWGLGLLLTGFLFQGGGTWLSYFSSSACSQSSVVWDSSSPVGRNKLIRAAARTGVSGKHHKVNQRVTL